jgi:hypothetical protein
MFELYIKYLLEGIAVAVAAYFIPRKKVEISEIIFIALSAAATFAVLDIFAPKVGDGARKGAGFGIGANTVGWPMGGAENFNGKAGKADEATDSDDSNDSEESKKMMKEHMYGNMKKVPKPSADIETKSGSESLEAKTISDTVSDSLKSVISNGSKTVGTESTDSSATQSTKTDLTDSSDMKSMDSTGSAVSGYDQTKQYSSF